MSEVLITRLSSKGQVVLPVPLRESLGLHTGEVFALFGEDDTIVMKRVELPSDEEFESLLEWGEEFAKKKGITRKDVLNAVK